MFGKTLTVVVIVSLLALAPPGARSEGATDQRVADMVSRGKLRAGIGVVAPHWAVKNTQTGELRGVAFDIAKSLAARLGVELAVVEYPSPPAVLEGLKTEAWDVGFLAYDPARATLVDFSEPFLEIDATYIVPASSDIQTAEAVDRTGVRVGVTRNSVEDITLKKLLAKAELRQADTIPALVQLLSAGEIQALAAPRPALLQIVSANSGLRVLSGRFSSARGAVAVPKGKSDHLSYVNDFIRESKASGAVQKAVEQNGVRGVQVP